MANIITGFARVLDIVLNLYMWVIIISAVISWVNPDPGNPIVVFLRRATEPVYYRVRRILGRFGSVGFGRGGLDFTPMIVILIIIFLRYAVVSNLYDLAAYLGRQSVLG